MLEWGIVHGLELFLCMKPFRNLRKPSWSLTLRNVDTQQRGLLDKQWGGSGEVGSYSPSVVEPLDPARMEPKSPQFHRHLNCCHPCKSDSRLKMITVIMEYYQTVDNPGCDQVNSSDRVYLCMCYLF